MVSADFDSLAELIRTCDTKAGPRIEVHAWLTMFPIATTIEPADRRHVFHAHPEWLSEAYTGAKFDGGAGKGYWLDPGHPGVQQHLFDVAMDVLTRYDIDGLCLDYIRYAGRDWGYNSNSVARFNAQFKRSGKPSPVDPDWQQFRRDQVTALLRKIYLSAMAVKPQVKISAGGVTFSPSIDSAAQWTNSLPYSDALQDWRAWTEEGILDMVVPLIA
jgi:uncharacterized lipoprotein YddW (UPF0748 family)